MASSTWSMNSLASAHHRTLFPRSKVSSLIKSHQECLLSSVMGKNASAVRMRLSTSSFRGIRSVSDRVTLSAASSSALPSALLFDYDGVLVYTEKDGHRMSFNDTFKEKELGVTWDVDLYNELLKIGDGKERLIDQALTRRVKVDVCSTSNEKAVSTIVSFLLGPERAEQIKIFAGDVVPRKKPDLAIYTLAASTLGVDPLRSS